MARINTSGVQPLPSPPLPRAVNPLVRRITQVQQLTLRAALERDPDLAFQVLMLDPLTTIPTDKAHAMFTEMLACTKTALPGWNRMTLGKKYIRIPK